MKIQSINPATGERIATHETMPSAEIENVVEQACIAQRSWRELTAVERAAHLPRLAAVLRGHRDEWARLMSLEMGKPITEARGEIEKCAFLCEVYAERAPEWLRDEIVTADGRRHVVAHEPLGVILSIMPWNYPFWQALRFGVPALAAGNASLLKHASNVTGCALAIEAAFRESGFPPALFRTVIADHGSVAALIADPRIAGVSLTGSTEAGVRVAEAAGRALKKVVLELGGSDPFIVLADADVEFTARNAVKGRLLCTGQSCIAAKRFIAVAPIAEAFTRRFAELMGQVVVGDPLDERTEIGAIVSADALRELEEQLADAVAKGARVLAGGRRLPGPGTFLTPAVVAGVTAGMRLAREEVFGPIAPVIVVADEDEAVAVANATEFGLGGSVWTRDLESGERIARRLEAGTTFVNCIVKSDPRMPFGGVKRSGLGRELARHGLLEFVNVKGINVYGHG